ncbi:MAG: aminopeptidase P family N-terminal domain-containing protein, partial [Dehalobacter sp.]|nr:aminopeptidase P family N-terminal domain-containing protein [Dehalobacter sp.]
MRLEKIRRRLAENKLDALIVTSSPNIFYLSGFTGTSATLLIESSRSILFTDFRYIEQAAAEAPGFEIIKVTGDP